MTLRGPVLYVYTAAYGAVSGTAEYAAVPGTAEYAAVPGTINTTYTAVLPPQQVRLHQTRPRT